MTTAKSAPRWRLPAGILALGAVSFLTDFSSEMIFPLLPLFLTAELGAGARALGMIEGVAETISSFLKLGAGFWTDRVRKRRPFILYGYGLASLLRPLIGLAQSWPVVLLLRFGDRVGKGLRTSPRDALIADLTPAEHRGRSYGFHRTMDHAGAVAGPLAAALLLHAAGLPVRSVFLLASVPALLAMLIIAVYVHEPKKDAPSMPAPHDAKAARPGGQAAPAPALGRRYRWLLVCLFFFMLGMASDAFILLRLGEGGFSAGAVAVLWGLHNLVRALSTWVGGRVSDRLGHLRMLIASGAFYALCYAGFALLAPGAGFVALFMLYGLYYGMSEPAERAFVAQLAPAALRGRAFGGYHAVVGLVSFPANLLFGVLWQSFGAGTAFAAAGAFAALATAMLMLMPGEGD